MHHFKPISFLHSSATGTGPLATLLRSRSVIRFTGPDTLKFLQGLLTNDVEQLRAKAASATIPTPNSPVVSTPPLYAALLTPQGRFLYDFFLYRPSDPGERLNRVGSGPGSNSQPGLDSTDEVFADVDSEALDELLEALRRYRLRAKVEIENVADSFSCWQRFGDQIANKTKQVEEPDASSLGWGAGVDICGMAASHANGDGWQWFKDPRLSSLGIRGIFPSNMTPPLVEADKESDERNYLLWRMQLGVAEGPSEIPKGEAIPLEYNLAGLNAISFDKGCYVGQELIARTHHRGIIRKRLLPMVFKDANGQEIEQRVPVDSEVVNSSSGKKVGSITTALGCRAMGLLKLEEAFRDPGSLTVQGHEDVKVHLIKPKWWPPEWFP